MMPAACLAASTAALDCAAALMSASYSGKIQERDIGRGRRAALAAEKYSTRPFFR